MNQCGRCQQLFPDNVRFCPKDGTRLHRHDRPEERYLGETLGGQFVIESVAGKGGMGTVYKAVQRSIDRQVAVKILHPDLVAEKEVVKRFLREGRAAARLQHPNIVTVHMVGETADGVPFLVMELVEGDSLESLLEKSGTFEEPRALAIARQIAFGLSEAHRQGIVHRDLKPANILISPKGRGREIVKILDFGIAKLLNTSDQSLAVTTGLIFGTPHYLAPEQASGEPVDGRTDLYALGVILFRMLTGVLPFDGDNAMQVVLRHLRDAPPSLRALNNSLDPETEALVLSCLSKRPSERPPSADAVVDALDAILPQRDPTGPYSQEQLGTPPRDRTPPPEVATPAARPAPKLVPAPAPVPKPTAAPVVRPAPAPVAKPAPAPQAPLHLDDDDPELDERPTMAMEGRERERPRPVIAARRPVGRAVRPPSKKVKHLDQSIELDSRELQPVRRRGKGLWLALAAVGVGGAVGLAAAMSYRTGADPAPNAHVATPPPPAILAPPDMAQPATKVAVKKKSPIDKGDRGDKGDGDLPMTVIGPAPTTPRRLDGPTTTPAPAPAPKVVAPSPAPVPKPEPPKPEPPPLPKSEPAAPEPTYPPPATDPTTIPQ